MILDNITWPSSITVIFEKLEDAEYDQSGFEDVSRVCSYLKLFIENGTYEYWCWDVFKTHFFSRIV